MPGGEKPIDLVRRFCDTFASGDVGELMTYFSEDAVYHNIPLDPVSGKEQIAATLNTFFGMVDKLEFRVSHILAGGEVVMTERVDSFVAKDKTIDLPVMGAFEVRDGKIAAWRDYFDMNQFTSQLG